MFWVIILLISAISLSGMSAYFSVTGMMEIFSAAPIAIMFMMIALESSKIITAAWLHHNWKNKAVNILHKSYMTSAVVVLMLITALGIYGFLAKGHLEQKAPLAGVELQLENKNNQLAQLDEQIKYNRDKLSQLDNAVNSLISSGKEQKALQYRARQAQERKEIQANIQSAIDQKSKITDEMTPLKMEANAVETKIGPIKYVAELFGISDTEGAIRIIIIMLMFAFDPLAVLLVISATISWDEYKNKKEKTKEIQENKTTVNNEIQDKIEEKIEPTINEEVLLEETSKPLIEHIEEKKPEIAKKESYENKSVDKPKIQKDPFDNLLNLLEETTNNNKNPERINQTNEININETNDQSPRWKQTAEKNFGDWL